ncbi:hypothetical protein CPC08DRAFT_718577 [Agrocybe pediades]|nr:hypothetical protein CPC08DRAFT_718577 [Agrocybe pediades]
MSDLDFFLSLLLDVRTDFSLAPVVISCLILRVVVGVPASESKNEVATHCQGPNAAGFIIVVPTEFITQLYFQADEKTSVIAQPISFRRSRAGVWRRAPCKPLAVACREVLVCSSMYDIINMDAIKAHAYHGSTSSPRVYLILRRANSSPAENGDVTRTTP